jgi:phage terminase large subunit-like protein
MGSTELNNLRDTLSILTELNRRWEQRRFFRLFPEEDTVQPDGSVIHAREKYAKHLEFFAAGAAYRERCFMAGNRVGKTYGAGGFEVSCHLTGLYPEWWQGRRFKRPVRAWAAGKTNETTRDIVQKTLLGDPLTVGGRKRFDGTGVVPGHLIGGVTWKQGVPDLADTVRIRHLPTGGYSVLGIKSYQQGRGSFEGTAQEVIWFDEEPPQDVYGESLIRTATTNGIIMLTFTPLEGLSEVVMSFLPENMRPADIDAVSEVYE